MKYRKNLIVWLWLLLCSLTLQNCVSSRNLNTESQKRDSTIRYNASKISDAEAAVVAYDMLTACEKNLADSTLALQAQRKAMPKKIRKAKWQGVGMGAASMLSVIIIIMR